MTQRILLLLVLVFAAAPCVPDARAQGTVPVGARVRVMVPDLTRGWIAGRMVSADTALVVIDPYRGRWGRPLFLGKNSVTQVQLSRGPEGTLWLRGAVVGTLVGAGVGAYAAWRVEQQEAASGGWLLVPLFGFGGTGIGALAGKAVVRERWDPVVLPLRVVLRGDRRVGVYASLAR
ncbi:MAG TPA: hypothetical protein VF263_05995 [Longimicrobiaceae bacterium]